MRIQFQTGGWSPWPVQSGALNVALTVTDNAGVVAEDTVYFTVPDGFHAHPDCVAAALSTLCGNKYEEIAFDFPISERCRAMVATCYGVAVRGSGEVAPRKAGRKLVLNFSGGLDSLAAYMTVGSDVRLVSMDFGGPFEREAKYFSTFQTLVCRTDFRQKGYALNDWRFMASGSLLLADYLDASLIGFGTIFEATSWNFSERTIGAAPLPQGPLGAIGSCDISWIKGLTEIGTAMAVLSKAPQTIDASLQSVAAPGSEKLFRKHLLIDIAAKKLGRPRLDVKALEPPKTRTPWGKSFAIDFLALPFVKEYGRPFVERWIDLPNDDEFKRLIASDLDFYAKYNPNLLASIPPELRGGVLARFHECGIYPFSERDFRVFDRVRKLLSQNHPM